MEANALLTFLIKARSNTYSGNIGEVQPVISGYKQYEFIDGKHLYRDMYILGEGRFIGMETIFFQEKPVWSMSYFGNFSAMTEAGADTILRKAMMVNSKTTRLWHRVDWEEGAFHYRCDGKGKGIEEISGTEEIVSKDVKLYYFSYNGGLVGSPS